MTTTTLKLDQIRLDGGTQIRATINQEAVAEYADARNSGAVLPPIIVFFDETEYWLADGFHRFHSAKKNKAKSMRVDVRIGTQRDAILFAVGSNDKHGLRRTNADKHKAVEALLADADWAPNSDRWIAGKANVSHTLVAKIRLESGNNATADPSNDTENAESSPGATDNAVAPDANKNADSPPGSEAGAAPSKPKSSAPDPFKKLDELIGKAIREVDEIGTGVYHEELLKLFGFALDEIASWKGSLAHA